jgi:hypothetical protein
MPDNADPKRPTFDERLEAISRTLGLAAAMRLDNDRGFRERFAEIDKLFAAVATAQEQVGGRISALVHIAELRQERLSRLEGGQQ